MLLRSFPVLALAVAAASASTMAFGASLWTRIDAPNPPPARFNHTMNLDPATQKLVVFGGRTGSATLGDTWVYDLGSKTWHEVKTTPAPDARFGQAAAYDPGMRRILLFGGQAGAFFNDTWAFDPVAETWRKLDAQGTAPTPRYGTSAVVDTKRNQLIVTHGFTTAGRFDDTLALDLATNTWSTLQPVGGRPLKRCLHGAAYDAKSDRMLLFGGCSSGFGPCPQGDLWSLDITARDWQELMPADSKPAARFNLSLVSDEAGRALLFGGSTTQGPVSDVWAFDVAAGEWAQLAASGDQPDPRQSHAAVWNAATGQMIVFGGMGNSGALNDLWAFAP